MTVAVVTPWRDQLHLLDDYARATEGARPVIVDTGSAEHVAHALRVFVEGRGGVYTRFERDPFSYAAACNRGIEALQALLEGMRVVVCLNNDVRGSAEWVQRAAQLDDDVIVGPAVQQLRTEGQPHVFVDGWCVAATLATWQRVKGWDDRSYVGCYHEDVDLSWRASRIGVRVRCVPWVLEHLGNTTARVTPGVYDNHSYNRSVFARRVREWKASA